MEVLQNRYDFVLFFDVENGNPNGDPDAGNMPRLDPETGFGLVTDVCLKRKIRNYVELTKGEQAGFHIYVQEKAVLNNRNKLAYTALGIEPNTKDKKLPKDEEKAKALTAWMCENFFDIRTFGAVMTTEVNTGQVRGPVQICFARSVEPVMPMEVSITRMAVTNEKDFEKERTMGRKFIVPYGLYRVEGFVSAPLAEKTGFTEQDAQLLWEALCNMFENDHSAARGKMSTRKLIVFKHDSRMGNAPAHSLFDRVHCARVDSGSAAPARAFADYAIHVDTQGLSGVHVEEKL